MAVSEDRVREALKEVVDPELFVNIIDLGLVYEVFIEEAGETPAAEGAEASEPAESAEQAPAEPASEPAPEPTAESAESTEGKCKVRIEMTLTSPACPAGPQLIAQAKDVISRIDGVADSEIKLVMSPPWTPDRMTEDAKDQLGIM